MGTSSGTKAPAAASGLLPDMRERVAAIASAVDRMLNTASVRADRMTLHLSLPQCADKRAMPSGSAAAADHASSSRATGTNAAASQEEAGACVVCYVHCLKAVDCGPPRTSPAASGSAGADEVTRVEKSLFWDGLTARVSAACHCSCCSAGREAPAAAAQSATPEDSAEADEHGDRFYACADADADQRDLGEHKDGESGGVVVLAGGADGGFCGKAELSLELAAVAAGGAACSAALRVSSASGMLVPLDIESLEEVLVVGAAVRALAQQLAAHAPRPAAMPLTASVLGSFRPVQGLREVAAVADEECSRWVVQRNPMTELHTW